VRTAPQQATSGVCFDQTVVFPALDRVLEGKCKVHMQSSSVYLFPIQRPLCSAYYHNSTHDDQAQVLL
jgi:hypothetical protein